VPRYYPDEFKNGVINKYAEPLLGEALFYDFREIQNLSQLTYFVL
jgi:hypothetical protein